MKKGKNREKVRKHRKRVGTDQELEKQREKYHHKKEMRQAELEKYSIQNCNMRNSDRENILHWKLAKDYLKSSLEMVQANFFRRMVLKKDILLF